MSPRVVAVIHTKGKLLVVHRKKDGREYYVFPGGGVEDGESLETALFREVLEETSYVAKTAEPLCTFDNRGRAEHYFLVPFEGNLNDVKLAGPEAGRQSEDNVYDLAWVDIDQMTSLKLEPEPMKLRVHEHLKAAR